MASMARPIGRRASGRVRALQLGRVLLAASLAVLAACGGGGGSGGGAPGELSADEPLAPPRPEDGVQLTISGFDVPAHGEAEVCQLFYLPNDATIDIDAYEIKMPPGSHHFVVWSYNGSNAADYPEGLFAAPGCIGVGPVDSMNLSQVAGAASTHDKGRYPSGTGLRLGPHHPVLLNSHYANSTDQILHPTVYVNLLFAKQPIAHPLEALTALNYNIAVPPCESRVTTARWTAPYDLYLLSLTSHMHKRGDLFTARLVAGSIDKPEGDRILRYGEGTSDGPPEGTTPAPGDFYRSPTWEHPTVLVYDEPRLVAKGTAVEFSCTQHNDKKVPLAFGPLSDDEMCILVGIYYRAESAPPPGTQIDGCLPQSVGLTCGTDPVASVAPGAPLCGDGKRAGSEQCDPGPASGNAACSGDCRLTLANGATLGTRRFALAFSGPNSGSTDFLNSIIKASSLDASLGVVSDGPLLLSGGALDETGGVGLSQDAEVKIGLGLLAGNGSVCLRFTPTAQAGRLFCRGGGSVNLTSTLDNSGRAAKATDVKVSLGVGGDAGPGAALLVLNTSIVQVAGPPHDCLTRDWSQDPAYPIPFTTGSATGTITSANGEPGSTVTMSRTGEGFDCSRWTDEQAPGLLQSMSLIAPNGAGAYGDVISQLALAGSDPSDGQPPVCALPTPTPGVDGPGGELAAITDQIFVPRCALPSCHSSQQHSGALVLEPQVVYGELVDHESLSTGARSAGLPRVKPGDPEQSFLMRKLEGRLDANQGSAMPLGNPSLSGDEIERIRTWIKAGAPLR